MLKAVIDYFNHGFSFAKRFDIIIPIAQNTVGFGRRHNAREANRKTE